MSNLDNLTAKTIADSEQKAAKILADAEAAAQKVIAEQEAIANQERDLILADAKAEASRVGELITLQKALSIRDENLKIKHQALDNIFAKATEQLIAMSEEQFLAFVGNHLAGENLSGYSIILPQKFVGSLDKVNATLAGKGCKGTLTLSNDTRKINGGFILCQGGVEINNTVESLVEHYRYELEANVLKTIF